jgi:hypothetical protein
MKTIRLFSLALLCMAMGSSSFAQAIKTETFKVSGECGICKKKIENSAKSGGASFASWSTSTKMLTVKYNSSSSNPAKIQQKIAEAGYDTPGFKATDAAYNKLDACCQYARTAEKMAMDCCGAKCEMKDGKCKDEAACKTMGCCTDSEKCKAMGCCGHDATGKTTMDCGASCCKKS